MHGWDYGWLVVALQLASHGVLLCYWHLHEGATLWGPLCIVLLLYCLSLRLSSCNSECTISCSQCSQLRWVLSRLVVLAVPFSFVLATWPLPP